MFISNVLYCASATVPVTVLFGMAVEFQAVPNTEIQQTAFETCVNKRSCESLEGKKLIVIFRIDRICLVFFVLYTFHAPLCFSGLQKPAARRA